MAIIDDFVLLIEWNILMMNGYVNGVIGGDLKI
jgi:hypothetical protein